MSDFEMSATGDDEWRDRIERLATSVYVDARECRALIGGAPTEYAERVLTATAEMLETMASAIDGQLVLRRSVVVGAGEDPF